jgi:hypothetical protein
VKAGGCHADAIGQTHELTQYRNDGRNMTTISEGHRRVAYCECGAQLAGDSSQELFAAAQRHLAHHHPQLLGALGLDLVTQMAEDVGG